MNHYMPWLEQKPCIVVNCCYNYISHSKSLRVFVFHSQLDVKLEDCRYRIESLNILHCIAKTINKQLRKLRSREEDTCAVEKLTNFLKEFWCSLEQQELPFSAYANPLDKRMRDLRKKELQFLKDDIFQKIEDLANDKSEGKVESISKIVEKLTDHLSRINYLCVEV